MRRLGHVHADLDHRRPHEHVEVAVAEARHLAVAVGGLHPPVDEPDPERRQELAQAHRLLLGRRGPDRLDLLVRQLVVAGPAGVGVGRGVPGRGGTDPGHDHERPSPGRGLLADLVPGPVELVGAPDPGPDRDPAGGRGPEGRHVEVGVQHLAERARDRGRGHQQHVGRPVGSLVLQRPALLDAEPVLLVDHGERQVREPDGLLEHRVGPDEDPGLPGREGLVGVPPGGGRGASR